MSTSESTAHNETEPSISPCSYCCVLNIGVVCLCLLMNIPIATTWSKRRLLNCISLFFVALSINHIILATFSIVHTIFETCKVSENFLIVVIHISAGFLVHTNTCFITALLAVYHCVLKMNKETLHWDLWNLSVSIQSLVASGILSLVLGAATLFLSGVLPEPSDTTIIIKHMSTVVLEDSIFILWLFGVVRIFTSIVIVVTILISLVKFQESEKNTNTFNDDLEDDDDVYNEDIPERTKERQKRGANVKRNIDPNAILALEVKTQKAPRGSDKDIEGTTKKSSSTNLNIKEAVLKNAFEQYREAKKNKQYNIAFNNAEGPKKTRNKNDFVESMKVTNSKVRYRKNDRQMDIYTPTVLVVSFLYICFELPVGVACFASSKNDEFLDSFKTFSHILDLLPCFRHSLLLCFYILTSYEFRRTLFGKN